MGLILERDRLLADSLASEGQVEDGIIYKVVRIKPDALDPMEQCEIISATDLGVVTSYLLNQWTFPVYGCGGLAVFVSYNHAIRFIEILRNNLKKMSEFYAIAYGYYEISKYKYLWTPLTDSQDCYFEPTTIIELATRRQTNRNISIRFAKGTIICSKIFLKAILNDIYIGKHARDMVEIHKLTNIRSILDIQKFT